MAFAGWEAAIAITIVILAGIAGWGSVSGWLTF